MQIISVKILRNNLQKIFYGLALKIKQKYLTDYQVFI